MSFAVTLQELSIDSIIKKNVSWCQSIRYVIWPPQGKQVTDLLRSPLEELGYLLLILT
jgi:hypothetical protein